MDRDRLYVDKKRVNDIRNIKNNDKLIFDSQKDVFLYALSLGVSCYNGQKLEKSKEGFFNSRELSDNDLALIYSLVFPELSSVEELTNTDIVFSKAEDIANEGFTVIFDEFSADKDDIYLKKKIRHNDELFDKAQENGMFEL